MHIEKHESTAYHHCQEDQRMPLKAREFVIPIGLRISPSQAEKLDLLAARTGRQRNDLLRYLIDQAQLSGRPEICIDLRHTRDHEELAGDMVRGLD
jgi:hypothetical protein